jgi:hypothetical protein
MRITTQQQTFRLLQFGYPFPQVALFGWLGRKTLELDAPLGWAHLAMTTVWAGNGINDDLDSPQNPRPTLFSVLLGAPGSGKSVTIKRALETIQAVEPRFRKTSTPASDRGLFNMFKPGKNDPLPNSDRPDTYLSVMDEFKTCLNKLSIQGSCLASTLNSLWYENTAGASDKTGSHDVTTKLNILGALPVEDSAQFAELFGSETTTGLYTRFCFGVGPKHWDWGHDWTATPGPYRRPTKVKVPPVHIRRMQEWKKEGRALGKPDRGRIAEQALRIAVITASANHDTIVTGECMDAAVKFAEWQESFRVDYKAGVSETMDGKINSAILDAPEALKADGVSTWVNFWDLARGKSWARKYGSSAVTRAKNSLIEDGTLIEELYDADNDEGRKKSNRTGCVRLRPKPGGVKVIIEPSEAFKKYKPKEKSDRARYKAMRDAGERNSASIGGTATALEGEVSNDV